jgi:hypothetical protein
MLGEPEALFKFVHPNREDPIDNRRQESRRWVAKDSGMLHGFIGYFDSKLYKDVHISINPATFSGSFFLFFRYLLIHISQRACSPGFPCFSRCATQCICTRARRWKLSFGVA